MSKIVGKRIQFARRSDLAVCESDSNYSTLQPSKCASMVCRSGLIDSDCVSGFDCDFCATKKGDALQLQL